MIDISLLEALYYSGEISEEYFYNNYYIEDEEFLIEKLVKDNLIEYEIPYEQLTLDPSRINYKYMAMEDYKLYKDYGYIVLDVVENNIILAYLWEDRKNDIFNFYESMKKYNSIKFVKIEEKLHHKILRKLILEIHGKDKEIIGDIPSFINEMIFDAINKKASDIHIEPFKDLANIRYRINGELMIYKKIDIAYIQELSSKLKIMSNLNIAEKRDIQDGEFTITKEGEVFNFRISVVPTIYGEKIAIRLLNSYRDRIQIGNLSLGYHLGDFKKIISKKSGLLLVTGPTGSGKTTSLYSILEFLKEPTNNIMTIEDPVEYKIGGINQIQVNNKIGFDFERALKAVLRQDLDILMLGEIRDKETAINATRAAITGHLVLSSLHTNTGIDAVDRLVDIGVEPYMVASSLTGIISQRLVKLLCPNCKEKYLSKEYHKSKLNIEDDRYIYKKVGCDSCNNGYIGRLGIFEVMEVDNEFKKSIKNGSIDSFFKEYKKDKSNYSLYNQCVDLILDGRVEFEEIYNIGVKPW